MRQTYRTDIKVINYMPPLSKKRRYAKSAMSLVGRDISTGFFKTLKAATLIIIEDEIEEELSKNDRTAQQEWSLLIHELSGSESDEERNDDIFANIRDANLALEKQITVVEKREMRWRATHSCSKRRGLGNGRSIV